ncbi:hypothetical protein C7U89_12735 [Bradyrhizobium sp. WBOS4]|nr:hypothetical protein [Bradyrhizobium sp. WBOS8]MDD1583805.1 hypothetical protein [Bradyrhizobium sp. WBOS4]
MRSRSSWRGSDCLPSPLVGEGGAKRRMRGMHPRILLREGARRERPLTRLAALRRATLSHKGRGQVPTTSLVDGRNSCRRT